MYAAAGGASLASRQARQRQRQKQLQQLKNQKELKQHQPKQYHNYTDDGGGPRLSRVERGALRPPPGPAPSSRRHSACGQLKEPAGRGRLRESPSICIPVDKGASLVSLATAQQQLLPQIEGGVRSAERRCSFVRQVEEMEKGGGEGGDVLDRCNHLCNFEVKEGGAFIWEGEEREGFGSLDYPFSELCMSTAASAGMQAALLIREKQRLRKKKGGRRGRAELPSHIATREIAPFPQYPPGFMCSQGRAAWQERERGRRCSLSEEARQHRIKQSEAHHRWMKRNRIHDSTYGTGSEEDDFFSVYHQSAAANALLYVGLGTIAIGSIIFFVGTGEKGFKTLELRLIGPTLVVCGILCCLIRVLLCACPSTCLRRRKKGRLKNATNCPHASRYPKSCDAVDSAALLSHRPSKKKVSIVPQPCTSTAPLPEIHLPEASPQPPDAVIELQNLELVYTEEVEEELVEVTPPEQSNETCLSVVVTSESKHSGIVLSPLQLEQ